MVAEENRPSSRIVSVDSGWCLVGWLLLSPWVDFGFAGFGAGIGDRVVRSACLVVSCGL